IEYFNSSNVSIGFTAPSAIGTYTVVAHYAGDDNHKASDSDPTTITITFPTSGSFVVDTQDALNVSKQGSITTTVTAISQSDYDSLEELASSSLSFRYHFTSSLNTAGVDLNATIVAGSYTGGLDSNFLLTAQNDATKMSSLVGSGNTSGSTAITVTMVAQVN